MTEVYFERTGHQGFYFTVSKIEEKKSDFQLIQICSSQNYGKCLFLDGIIQLSEKDEFLFHETSAQPGIHILGGIKKALILGGGDGFIAREFLKHPSTEKVVLVDIDGEVIEMSKKYFSKETENVFENPKLETVIRDAFKYVSETKEKFDMVVMDLTDVERAGDVFYSPKFLGMIKKVMSPGAVFSSHIEALSLGCPVAQDVAKRLQNTFIYSTLYAGPHIPCFGQQWGFFIGSDNTDVTSPDYSRIKETFQKAGKEKFKFYSPEMHKCMFNLPKWMKESIQSAEIKEKIVENLKGGIIDESRLPKV